MHGRRRSVKTTVDQPLMRGLVTALPNIRQRQPAGLRGPPAQDRLGIGCGEPRRGCPHDATSFGATTWAIAHRNADISRATAVATTVVRLPLAVSTRYRLHKRTCAFQAMSRTSLGRSTVRRSSFSPTLAPNR